MKNEFESTLDIINEIDIEMEERLRPQLREFLNLEMGLNPSDEYQNESAVFSIYATAKQHLCELRARVRTDEERWENYILEKELLPPPPDKK